VRANTEQQTQMHAQCSDVGTRLAADPEDTQLAVVVELDQLALVDRTDTELTLNSRDEWRSLEERASQRF